MGFDKVGLVVTGGSSGIGAAICQRLTPRGLEVFDLSRRAALSYDRDDQPGTDVRDAMLVAQRYDQIAARLGGPPAYLVTCAAVIGETVFPETPIEEWCEVIDTNLTGTFIVAQEHARRLIRAGRPGKIVLFGSASGRRPSLANVAYGVAKAGVVALGIGLARGLERYGIKVYTICPSHVDTPMLRARWGVPSPGETWLAPDDIGAEVERLLLTTNYVDGQPIYISGMVRAKQE